MGNLIRCTVCGGTGIAPQTIPFEPSVLPPIESPALCPACKGTGFVDEDDLTP
jgi:DnaJ-class molecular chaperone